MRSTKTLHDELDETIARLMDARRRLPAATTELRRNTAGFPARHGSTDSGGSAQPNEDGKPAGLERHLVQPDEVDLEMQQLDNNARAAYRAATNLLDVCQRWAEPSKMRAPQDAGDQGCEVIARIKRGRLNSGDPLPDDDLPCFEPTYKKAARGPKAKGHAHKRCNAAHCDDVHVLERPHRLGVWAYMFVQKAHRLPTDVEVIAHLRGESVARNAHQGTGKRAGQR